MERIRLVITLMLLLHTVISIKVTFDACVSSSPHSVKYGLSFLACAKQCQCLAGCKLLNYRRFVHRCEFYNKSPNTTVRGCKGNAVVYMDDIDLARDKRRCLNNETKTCPDLVSDENTTVLGNMHQIGSKRLLICNSTFEVIGNKSTICQMDGSWSEVGTCKKTCPGPKPGPHMSFTDVRVLTSSGVPFLTTWGTGNATMFESTTITVVCDNGTRRFGPETAECVDGSWTEFAECKPSTMRESCTNHSDCIDQQSECRGGKCWCQPGFSFDRSNLSCVQRCPAGQYGTTFQVVEGYRIPEENHDVIHNVSSIRDCIEECLGADGGTYTCISAEYMQVNRRCNLNTDVENITYEGQ